MTPFNPDNKEELTFRECLAPAMDITDQADADQYLAAYIEFTQQLRDELSITDDGLTAEQVAKQNLGYYAGYYDDETRKRVERLFLCQHPIFGSIKDNGGVTPDDALNLGLNLGKASP